MKLLELGSNKWRVLAVCDERGRCQVLEALMRMPGHGAKRMLSTLREFIPERGPNFQNREKAKTLEKGICVLREQPGKGPKPRVFFFLDGDTVVVATEAFAKRNEDVKGFIERADKIRTQYFHDRTLGRLLIERIDPEE